MAQEGPHPRAETQLLDAFTSFPSVLSWSGMGRNRSYLLPQSRCSSNLVPQEHHEPNPGVAFPP